jgi:hypothetical protein
VSHSIKDFWSWVEFGLSDDHKRLHHPDVSALDAAFETLPATKKNEFSAEFQRALEAANRLDIWQLCSLIYGQPCGDDSFSYFRRWLILQGKEVYTTTLNAPDDFYILYNGHEKVPAEPFIESAGLVEDHASVVQDRARPAKSRVPWTWLDSSSGHIRNELPKMWRLVGEQFLWEREAPANKESACDIPGLGMVSVGDRLLHKAGFGVGTVANIVVPESGIAEMEFAAGKKTLRISSAFFERA